MGHIRMTVMITPIINANVNDKEAINKVQELKNYITKNFYTCNNETLKSLGLMYVSDERFKNNIDKYKSGTAEFVYNAIIEYVKSK